MIGYRRRDYGFYFFIGGWLELVVRRVRLVGDFVVINFGKCSLF